MRSAIHAASQQPGGRSTDVDDAPTPTIKRSMMVKLLDI